MKHALVAAIALTLMVGCVRFGYDAVRVPPDNKPDASHEDAGTAGKDGAAPGDGGGGHTGMDGSMQEAGPLPDANPPGDDASSPSDGSTTDASDGATGGAGGSGGGGDAAVDGGAKDPCPASDDVLFCDDFEEPPATNWDYPHDDNGGAFEQSTTWVRTGTYSLHAYTRPSGGQAQARWSKRVFDRVMSGEVWLRYYYYLPSTVSLPGTSYFSSGALSEITGNYVGYSLVIRQNSLDLASGGYFEPVDVPFPRDRWVCVELRIQIHPSQGVFTVYFDGSWVGQTPTRNTLPPDGYTVVDVGIHYADAAAGNIDVYVDAVAAGLTRPGCNPPP